MDFSTNTMTLTTIIFFGLFFPAATTADEAAALLAFRRSSIDLDPSNNLQSWTTAAGESPTPCSWTGVTCSTDGRVTGLNINNYGLTGSLRIGDLMALPSLQYISLQGNAFSGNLSYPAGTNCSFVSVDLSANSFSDTISGNFLTECKRLVELNMSRNSIPGGIFPFGSSIQRLDLSGNKIADSGLLSFSLSNCRSLRYLNFSDNLIPGKLRSVSDCTNLEALDVSYNFFVDGIPAGFFSGLPLSLTQLFLTKSNFTGDFSKTDFGTCGGNVTALDVSSNLLTGVGLPPSLLNCRLLQSLDLSGNGFTGSIPGFVANLTSLKHLSLANNNYTGAIPPELSGLCRSLLQLDLSSNSLIGGLPSSFIGCSSIQRLNLGSNNLSGDFINTVVSAIPSLTHLLLPFNYISGGLPLLSPKNSTLLEVIDLSSNDFTGPIPVGFCSSLPSLQKIQLQNNYLNGTIPVALAECTNLITINLSFNELSGAIPPEIFALPKLTEFISWANSISGELPNDLCLTSTALEILILNHNMITGSIPPSITKCPNLAWLSLSGNCLTGEIPITVCDLQKLAIMQLANNSLSGAIPARSGSFKSLIWLDLYSNNLSGVIPVKLAARAGLVTPNDRIRGRKFAFLKNEQGSTCPGFGDIFEFSGIRPERFSNHPFIRSCPTMRVFTGLMDPVFTSNGSLLYLDLSHNSLTGPIPDNFGNMLYLQVLNLGHNQLTGPIPRSFGSLKSVGILDLSHNNLSGGIPGEVGSLSFLAELDVSYNNLSGPIPSSGQLTTFPESQFVGNPGLCGLPLPPCVSEVTSQKSNSDSGAKKRLVGVSVLVGIGISVFIVLVLVFILFRVKSNHRTDDMRNGYIESSPTTGTSTWKLDGVLEPLSINVSTFEKPLRKLTFAHLLEATNGFSEESLIGSGGFGEVYRARFKDGTVVAIKKLVHATSQGDREFVAEMETIGKIKHRHLVPLLGYCKVGEERLLVYKYMKHGSLDNVLQARKEKGALDLDWATRKKIAVGSARGLAFLHHSCIPHIIHRDMKSSNVLIDDGVEARVSDFGMARLMNAVETHLSVSSLAGTPGYVPPEYYQSFRCTTKGDVYSYGVVLLELLTGKKPIDSNDFGDNNLVGWAKQLVKENRFGEIIDSELLGRDPDEEADIFRFLKIACDCVEDTPLRRPTMVQVLSAFKEIQGDSAVFQGISHEGTAIDEGTVIDESREKMP